MSEQRGGGPVVKLAGAKLDDITMDSLIDVRVEQSLHVAGRFAIRFEDQGFALFDSARFEIGGEVEILFRIDNAETSVAKGEITAISVEQGISGWHELVVSGFDKSHRLGRGAAVRTFGDVTDSDVVDGIAKEHGLTAKAKSSTQKHAYLIQDRNDHDFLRERAHAIGYTVYGHDKDLHFEPQAAAGAKAKATWGKNLQSFKVRLSAADAITEAEVRGWDPATQKPVKASVKAKNDKKELGTDAKAATDAATAAKKLKGHRFGMAAPVMDQGEAKALAQAVVERAVGEEMLARGEVDGNPNMRAGGEVDIDGVGERLSGTYLLTRVEHIWGADAPYVTRFESGGRQPRSLVDLLGNGHKPGVLLNGLAIGVVTSVADPEGSSRIKVKFPALSDEDESAWARIVMPGAGKDRGLIVFPEVDDEVIVGFEHGDLRRPVVLGGLWSNKNTIPLPNKDNNKQLLKDGKVQQRAFHSRLGHKLTINDGDKPAEKYYSVELSDKKTSWKLAEDLVELKAPSDITITGDKKLDAKLKDNITIDGGKEITIKAKTKLVLDAPQIEIKGKTSVLVDGAKVDVKAKGMMTVEAGGINTIKGSLVKIN